MALKFLSTADMVNVSDFARRGTPERLAIEKVPEAAALLPTIDGAVSFLIQAQPPSESSIAKLTVELAEDDLLHDNLIRGIYGRLDSEIALATDAKLSDAYLRARDALFPTGLSVVNRSYTEQSGEATLRASRVTTQIENTLKKLKAGDSTTLLEHYESLQAQAKKLGATEKRRTALQVEGSEQPKTVEARNRWIRTVNTLAAVLETTGVDEAPILGRVRIAEARAERARVIARGGGEVLEPVTPGVPVSPEVVRPVPVVTPVTPTPEDDDPTVV